MEFKSTLITYVCMDHCCFQIMKFNIGGSKLRMEMTPLADASSRGRLEIVQALVENKAEVNCISQVSHKFTCTLV